VNEFTHNCMALILKLKLILLIVKRLFSKEEAGAMRNEVKREGR
jgi:hypothetical protein